MYGFSAFRLTAFEFCVLKSKLMMGLMYSELLYGFKLTVTHCIVTGGDERGFETRRCAETPECSGEVERESSWVKSRRRPALAGHANEHHHTKPSSSCHGLVRQSKLGTVPLRPNADGRVPDKSLLLRFMAAGGPSTPRGGGGTKTPCP